MLTIVKVQREQQVLLEQQDLKELQARRAHKVQQDQLERQEQPV